MREKKYLFKVIVTGNRLFPIDMLRRDCLYPSTEVDSNKIGRVYDAMPANEDVEIELRGVHHYLWQPTIGRWESFGWKVLSFVRTDQI